MAGGFPRPVYSACLSWLTPALACSSHGLGGPEEEQALRALERMLQQKERHLEGQQAKLAAWAAELQRREAALAWQQAQLAGRPGEAAGAAGVAAAAAVAASPGSSLGPPLEPILSASPVLPGGHATPPSARPATPSSASPLYAARAGLAAQPQAEQQQQQQASPAALFGGGGGSPGALPDSPAVPGEWTEEFEPGVLLSFAAEGGARKLRRIRFSRSLFSADSAKQVGCAAVGWFAPRHVNFGAQQRLLCCVPLLCAATGSYECLCTQRPKTLYLPAPQWYEANKHRLQATGTPHAGAAAPSLGAATDVSSSQAGSQPGTPLAAAAGEQPAAQQQAGEQQQQHQQAGSDMQSTSEGCCSRPGTAVPAAAGLLHYRQSSRNLSFDARELAAFHERLAAQAAGEGVPRPGVHSRPSRLSAVGKPGAGAAAPACVIANSAAGSGGA